MKSLRILGVALIACLMIAVSGCVEEPYNIAPVYVEINDSLKRTVRIEELAKGYDENGFLYVQLQFSNPGDTVLSLRVRTLFLDETGAPVDETADMPVILRSDDTVTREWKTMNLEAMDLRVVIIGN